MRQRLEKQAGSFRRRLYQCLWGLFLNFPFAQMTSLSVISATSNRKSRRVRWFSCFRPCRSAGAAVRRKRLLRRLRDALADLAGALTWLDLLNEDADETVMRKLGAMGFLQHQKTREALLCSHHAEGPRALPPKNAPGSCISNYLLSPDSVTRLPLINSGSFFSFLPPPLCILDQSAAFFKNAFVGIFFYAQLKCERFVTFQAARLARKSLFL